MTRMTPLSSPLLLGFEEIERVLDRVTKSGSDGYPPYNIERISSEIGDKLRITLAVAGFTRDQLSVTVEDNQLVIRGQQSPEADMGRQFLHRGIAARQFQRAFVLAEGIEILSAALADGLLSIDLARPEPERTVRTIEIGANPAPQSRSS
ncbi:Hsp20 family protein [Acuticoccus sp. M5D2P5]|uniref:Hsp20 family protein n=1 Tax=Acuticoccus kalidii TaxID=2910977 RepID=UPI001F209D7F|nr:Hsp20 family protein [Acuticoccus kalidii]MCF3932331.1 Hsp20 family protein [Acuticoccus kalidii]